VPHLASATDRWPSRCYTINVAVHWLQDALRALLHNSQVQHNTCNVFYDTPMVHVGFNGPNASWN
jgi:hypothetical protein